MHCWKKEGKGWHWPDSKEARNGLELRVNSRKRQIETAEAGR